MLDEAATVGADQLDLGGDLAVIGAQVVLGRHVDDALVRDVAGGTGHRIEVADLCKCAGSPLGVGSDAIGGAPDGDDLVAAVAERRGDGGAERAGSSNQKDLHEIHPCRVRRARPGWLTALRAGRRGR